MATFSDRELDRRIKALERDLAKCKPGGWTAEIIAHNLEVLKKERELPREQRHQWEHGSI